jgi:hypothetical protein
MKLYRSDRNTKLEIGGTAMIKELLRIFTDIVVELTNKNFAVNELGTKSKRLARLIGGGLANLKSTYPH